MEMSLRDGPPGIQGSAVELYSRIERVSLHSKDLTDGTYVTSHEETWSSTQASHVSRALPDETRTGFARSPPPEPSAVSP
jgi:hypothetical protein